MNSLTRFQRLASALCLTGLTSGLMIPAEAANPEPQVVPAVRQWNGGDGLLNVHLATIVVDAAHAKELAATAAVLRSDLEQLRSIKVTVKSADKASPGSIFLTLAKAAETIPGSYQLAIADNVTISAPSAAGVLNGTRTLLQMIAQGKEKGNASLAKGTVADGPLYRNRSLMLDVGRKPFPLPVLKDYIRMMSWYKMNELHVHFSDEAFGGSYAAFRIQSDTFPGLAAKDFSYTKKDIRELQDFAKAFGVTIVPEFDMPGHARCFTDYWPDTMLKGYPNYVDVTNPKTIENLKKLLDEMIPLFDGPDIHIGTDEYRVGDRPDLHEAFRKFINTMNAHVRSHGKNCRIWSGFEHMKGTTEIDPTVIIDMWETDDAKGQIAKGHSIINSNHGRTYIVPGCKYYGISRQGIYQGWEPWMVSGDNSKNPTKDEPKLMGGKLHVWCDQGPTGYTQQEIADLTVPGLQAFAEKLWGTKGSPDYPAFVKRTELTMPVPGVSVLERLKVKADGVALDLPGEQTLATADSVIPLPLAKAERGDLEYPWTLTFDIQPSDKAGANRGVIFSSDLAEICAGSNSGATAEVVTEFADGTKRRGKVNTVGLGTVRLAGAPQGKDPFSGYLSHDVSKFSGKTLPANAWSSVCIVGSAGRHTIYLNGEKIADINNQMLCPLRWIGSKTGNSFIGKVRKVRVVNRALSAKEIGRAAGLDIPDNLAAAAQVTASASDLSHGFKPELAVDGDPGSRWSSGATSTKQWLAVDLGKEQEINTVNVTWEQARAGQVEVEVSADGKEWKPVAAKKVEGSATTIEFPTVKAQQVRLQMSQPNTGWGYSVFELEVLKRKSK